MRYTREQVLERLRAQVAAGKPIVGAGAGTGISAKFAEAGGADLIIIYNSGRYRMAGHGSLSGLLAFGDANQIVYEMGEREVLPGRPVGRAAVVHGHAVPDGAPPLEDSQPPGVPRAREPPAPRAARRGGGTSGREAQWGGRHRTHAALTLHSCSPPSWCESSAAARARLRRGSSPSPPGGS